MPDTAVSTRSRGRAGEDEAVRHLERHGLAIVDRNVELAGAELDIVARDGDTLVFVEVRTRAEDRLGDPLETIDRRKRTSILRAASAWLVAHDAWEQVPVRFDVVGIVDGEITWIRDAFDAS